MTQSTRVRGPGRGRDATRPPAAPRQPHPTLPEGFGELDRRAIDTARVLAMDAVQKVGNGHPGTAMSMAPTAYLLFQKWLRHDPSDPNWVGRDRFVLSMGHSSLTLYVQLYLSGYGMELDDLQALRTWGSQTPGHPEVNHTPGVETTTGPLGQGVGNAVGMAMAARRERGLLDPDAPEGESLFDHTIWCLRLRRRPRGGRQRRGVVPGRHPAAGQPGPRLRRQQDLHRGRHERRLHRGRRQALRGLRLARAARGRRRGPRRRRRRVRRRQGRDRPPVDHRAARRSSAGRRRTSRTPAPRTARRSATTRSRPPRRSSASTRRRPSTSPPRSSSTPARSSTAARRRTPPGRSRFDAWKQSNPDARRAAGAHDDPHPARGLGGEAAQLGRRPEGRRHPQGLRRGPRRALPGAPRAVGRLGRPGGEQQHRRQGRTVVPAGRTGRRRCGPAAPTAARCTSVSASTRWARS